MTSPKADAAAKIETATKAPLEYPKIYDISPLITSELAVFPGDISFLRSISMEFAQGHHLELSSISTTLHLGSHVDAPSHYHKDGKSIELCSLETYLGPCQVVDATGIQDEITLEKLGLLEIMTPRILFKTNSIKDIYQWQDKFTVLSVELVEWLAHKKVKLIGIDTPSMDHAKSKDLKTHQAFFRTGIAVLEGLVLNHVKPGTYILSALPLKIQGAEASPVRAALIETTST